MRDVSDVKMRAKDVRVFLKWKPSIRIPFPGRQTRAQYAWSLVLTPRVHTAGQTMPMKGSRWPVVRSGRRVLVTRETVELLWPSGHSK